MADTYLKPLPIPSAESAPYWEYCKKGELRIQRCDSCGAFVHYPRVLCPHDASPDLQWTRVSGRGSVFSFTISHRAFHPGFSDDVPYVIAIVELEEGPRLMCRIRDAAPEDVRVGLPVEVFFEAVTPEVTLPFFRPAAQG